MDLGVCVASKIDDIGYVVEAERLGYTHAWMADSQMIWSDPYATLALAADRTTTIRLGTGVAVAATRPAPVTAASIATINQLAAGRTFLGIGTGNTAMRMMGHKPMPISEFDDYLASLTPLLRGEESDVAFRGRTSPVRHLMATEGFVNFSDPIPVYVSGFGPKSLALAGRYGDGAVLSIPLRPGGMEWAWPLIERGARGRDLDRGQFLTCSLTTIVVLEPGEAPDSDRAKHLCGAFAMASMHYSYDQYRNFGRAPSAAALSSWDDYVRQIEQVPEEVRHQHIHRGHNCWVEPDEERFVTRELMEASCLIGTAEQIIDRLGHLGDEGLDQVMILPNLEPRYEVLEQVAVDILPHI